jgi:hypothetical protein
MSLTDDEILELHELLDGLVENNLSASRKAKLAQWIAESEEVRKTYVHFMDMSSSLAHYADERLSDEIIENKENSSYDNIIKFIRPVLLIAALLVAGFYLPRAFVDKEEVLEIEVAEDSLSQDQAGNVIVDTVAVLTKTVGVEWAEDSSIRPESGSTLEPCVLKLVSGLAQIEFLQGSIVVLEGPVEFEIINPNGGALSIGKLRASVPEVASGFAIEVPKGNIIDLGTEFGLHVHEGGSTEVFVYKGKVLYEGKTETNEDIFREISGGESIFVDPYGHPRWVEMPTEPFMGKADLAYRSMEESQRRHAAWVDLSKEIAQDPKTRLYFSFDNHSPWSRLLRDESVAKKAPTNGAVIGCKWEEGRWAGKGALSFARDNDLVRLNLPRHLSSATLAAWIKIDTLPSRVAPVICTEPNFPGAACWSINPMGQLALRVSSTKNVKIYESAVAFGKDRIGHWTHIATTYDSDTKMIVHYVDGRSFSKEKIEQMHPLNFEKSLLGHSGSITDPSSPLGVSLKGSIDEFVLFEVAYDEGSIRRLYEIGRPFDPSDRLGPVLP